MQKDLLTKFRVAIYGVLVEDGRVLLTDTKVPSGVITNFPGGGLELGESPIEALEREFQEETSLCVRVDELLFCSRGFQQNPEYMHEQLIHIYYRVSRATGAISMNGNGDDVAAVRWLAPAQLSECRILGPDLEFIRHSSFTGLFLEIR